MDVTNSNVIQTSGKRRLSWV